MVNAKKGKTGQKTIHKLRVSSRTLRALLKNFQFLLTEEEYQSINGPLKAYADELSVVRELDVLHGNLKKDRIKTTKPKAIAGLQGLKRKCTEIRKQRRTRIPEITQLMINSAAYEKLDEYISKYYRLDQLSRAYNHPLVQEKAQSIVELHLRKIAKAAVAMEVDAPDDTLHSLRIALKNFRYTLADFSCLHPQGFQPQLEKIGMLQDRLGNIHDRQVWLAQIEDIHAVIGEDRGFESSAYQAAGFTKKLLRRKWQKNIQKNFKKVKKIWSDLQQNQFWFGFLKDVEASDSQQGCDPVSSERKDQHLEDLPDRTPE